jgi:CheY-like chemotaxis protein
MNRTAKILIVDDTPANVRLLASLLTVNGYDVETAASGEEGLKKVAEYHPDLLLLDIMMPGINGYEVCRAIRANPATGVLPVVLVTSLDPAQERIKGLEAGADDFLTKPINQAELLARVKSLLRIKSLYDQIDGKNAELAQWNRTLEQRVADSVAQIIMLHQGTIEHFAGDGIMIFFNDPVVVENPAERAVRMAMELHRSFESLSTRWQKRGYNLSMGIGIAQGYATLGMIGFEGRFDYGAIGTVTNLAARLCAEAKAGQTLVGRRVLSEIEPLVDAESLGEVVLKGFARPVSMYNVVRLHV